MKTIFVLLPLFVSFGAAAQSSDEWVKAKSEVKLPGDTSAGQTYFSTRFSHKTGKFSAMPESMTDSRQSISGKFLVGKFMYTYSKPIPKNALQPQHDKMIVTAILDCKENFAGTLSTAYYLNDAKMGETAEKESEVLMTQLSGETTTNNLCRFAKERGAL